MTKPFSARELVARIQAILRRTEAARHTADDTGGQILRAGAVALDVRTRVVTLDDEVVHLTPTEFDLLRCLLDASGTVLTREQLLAEVWGYRDGSGARTVDSHVRSLRRKLGDGVIRTVHAVGYAIGDAS